MAPHAPKFYLLSSAKKGKYLLDKGDAEQERKNIGKAISYYEEARKYCNDEAQKRLDKLSPILSIKNNVTQNSEAPHKKAKHTTQQYSLAGPYFPTLAVPSFISTPASASLSQESTNYTIHDAPSTLALANMFKIANEEEEMRSINMMIHNIIQQFDENFSSKESIQELAVLAAIPDQRIFIAIITQLLKVEKASPTFPELTIHGLAVILTSAPKEIDLKERQGLLNDILERLQYRLTSTRTENNSEELLPLLRALSALFDAMLCRMMRHVGRLEVFNPTMDHLAELASDDNIDPEISFMARYASQSLVYIGNDESLAMSVFRRGRLAIGIIADIKTAVLGFNVEVFDSVYEKIMSMSDYNNKLEWYQGLLFLNCLLANEDLSSFEKFVIESKLNSDENFMQGVCLLLEQVASIHPNQQVSFGAQKLLQDLESNPASRIQLTARLVLDRLSITSDRQPTSKVRLAPVWDKSWYFDPNSFLLKSVQDTLKRESNVRNLEKIIPTSNSMSEVNKALMDHYSNQLTIRRVTGKPLRLESCYINLAIVEASSQRKQDEEELKKQSEKFVRMPTFEDVSSTNTEKPIPLEEILDKRKLLSGQEGVPKRILIIGRAGVGKTTFCKKLIHTYHNGQWNDRFDAVLWLPLRLLKGYTSRILEDFLIEKYFTKRVKNEREGLAREFIKSAERGRVLFILDGLDEFVTETDSEEGDPLRSFVMSLLEEPNIIVTTRPYGNDRSLLRDLDLELETVGFSTENVEQYVKSVIKNTNDSKAVLDFIQQTPLIQGLVNIPIQLDLICFSWKDLETSGESTTITQLYQTIVQKLWCSDAMRMRKGIDGKLITENLVKNLSPDVIESNMTAMVEFLGYLAFRGLKNNHQIIFDHSTLIKADQELRRYLKRTGQAGLPAGFLDEIMKTSVLHTTETESESDSDNSQEIWNFIHLTFQEYFAATWLSKLLIINESSSSNSVILKDKQEAISFIRQNKYNPRYEIVWWMMAGQLKGDALKSYFQLLQDAPRDLIGIRHQLLLAGCYKEAYAQLSTDSTYQVQGELAQWLSFELTFPDDYRQRSILGKQSVFPEEILIKSLGGRKDQEEKIIRALFHRRYLRSSAIQELIQLTKSTDSESAISVIQALETQSTVTEPIAVAFVQALQHEDPDVRRAAASALRNQSFFSESTTKALVAALQDETWHVRESAANAIGKQCTITESAMAALLITLKDEFLDVRSAVARALGNQSVLPESITAGIVAALQDDDWHVRASAVDALGKQSTISESTMKTLVAALQDEAWHVRDAAVIALGNQPILPASTTSALLTALQDEDDSIRHIVARVFGMHSNLPESAVTALVTALQDEATDVREEAANALGNQPALSESAAAALITTLGDEDSKVREAASNALGNQSTLSESTATNLVAALLGENWHVREAVADVFGKQSSLSESATAALVSAIKNQDENIRFVAAKVLGSQTSLSQLAITALVYALQDDDLDVRDAAAETLGSQSALSETTISDITAIIQDEKWNGREVAVNALSNQCALLESTISVLAIALQDKDWNVRYAVANAISNQSSFSESAMTALVTALQDENSDVRCVALLALGNQPTLSDSTITALVAILRDDNSNVRNAAAHALVNQSTLSVTAITALVTTLQDEYSDVRASAAKALGNQLTLSDSTAIALVTALQDVVTDVREAAAKALGKQSKLSEFAITALVIALQDTQWNVRSAGADALGSQLRLSEPTMTVLVTVLQDEIPDVRYAAAKALGKQAILPGSILSLIAVSLSGKYYRKTLYDVLGTKRIYLSVKNLTETEIEMLYRSDFFDDSCNHHVSLFVHNNRLQIYTEQGFEDSEELSFEVLSKVKSAFMKVQKSGGIQCLS